MRSSNYLPALGTREYKLFISHAWEHNAHYEGLIDLLNREPGFRWANLSVPKENPLDVHPVLTQSHRYLVRQLDEQIRLVDCVLVIAGMYVKYRGWIQSEIEAALEFHKPIIAVLPFGSERVPSELNSVTVAEWVGWRGSSVTAAIQKHALRLLAPRRTLAPPPLSSSIRPANVIPLDTSGMWVPGLEPPSQYPRLEGLLSGLNAPKKR